MSDDLGAFIPDIEDPETDGPKPAAGLGFDDPRRLLAGPDACQHTVVARRVLRQLPQHLVDLVDVAASQDVSG